MKPIEEIVRDNLLAESKRLGGDAKLAALLEGEPAARANRVYQWLKAKGKQRRNPNRETRRELERLLGHPEGWLETAHNADVSQTPEPASAKPGLPESRSGNNVKSIRLALQSLFVVLHEKQPVLAELVARDLVATAGTDFAKQGFANTLLGTLRGAGHMSEAERLEPQPLPGERASRRGVSVAKKT